MIVLPASLRRIWKDGNLKVRANRQQIILEGPALTIKKVNLDEWKRAAGILKGRKIIDPVIWQRTVRREWERKIV